MNSKQSIEEAAEKYGFQIPYDGTNDFYNKDKVNGFIEGANWQLEQFKVQEQKPVEDKLSEWQLCPKCLGKGFHEPDVAGTSTTELCCVCHGNKVIIKPHLKNLQKQSKQH